MSEDYRLPEGFVNPVPDPDEKKPKPWAGRSLPESGPISGEQLLKGIGILIALVFIFSDTILDIAGDPVSDAVDSAESWAKENGLTGKDDGSVKLENSYVTASYTPADDEEITEGEYNGTVFTGSQWALSNGNEIITLRDYNFDNSPVENEDVTDAYYKASAQQVNNRAGHEVDVNPIKVDGRRGMVWRSEVDGGGWLLVAEFPGDPSTVRLTCSAESADSVVATQCEEVLDSLQFGD